MIKTTVNITDSGMEAFSRQVKKLNGRVDIGVFGDQNGEQVIIAGANEFGTHRAGKNHNITIPQRSFLRSTLDEQKEAIRQTMDSNKVKVVTGKLKKKTFLDRLGLWFTGRVQAKIQAGGTPYIENALSVKQGKVDRGRQRPIPLNDEGRLRQSVKHKVKI